MATISKKFGKWYVQIRRSFHKPIYKSFIAKQDAHKWARETERLIEIGQFVDTTEANKTTLRTLLERYEREAVPKKRTTGDKYLIFSINLIFALVFLLVKINFTSLILLYNLLRSFVKKA